jgi:hypothetical protein
MFGKEKRKRRDLEQNGKRAPATVVEIAATGWETSEEGFNVPGISSGIGKEIVRKTSLRVRPADEPEFELTQRVRYGAYGGTVPKAGEEIEVLYDPEDHEKMIVAPPTAEEEAIRTAEALSKAKIGFGVDLRGGGSKDAAEAMQANEEAMNQAQAMLEQMDSMTGGTSAPKGSEGSADNLAQLERLQALKEKGELSDSEFEAAKAKLLGEG